jgi:hypothetical protein
MTESKAHESTIRRSDAAICPEVQSLSGGPDLCCGGEGHGILGGIGHGAPLWFGLESTINSSTSGGTPDVWWRAVRIERGHE